MYCELYKEDYTTLMGMDPADLKKLYLSLLIPIRIKLDYKFRNTNKKKGL
ncbi:MAG: hypothetical protein JST26_16770 [Bacteroidetes bacterium]|nr:hypothetical protein [Bacteroidota bacterium]